jgi:DNA primase small subunit
MQPEALSPRIHHQQRDIQVIDTGLRDDFGFKHILWVYSGRRGIHCWVCDESARSLSDEQRAAVANFFAIYKGQEKSVPKVALSAPSRNHPSVERAYDMLLSVWEQVRGCHPFA